jgi:hypothetical protein
VNIWKRPNSPHYSYRFVYRGKIYSRSTGTSNRHEAMDIATAARLKILRQEAGIEEAEPAESLAPAPLAVCCLSNGG